MSLHYRLRLFAAAFFMLALSSIAHAQLLWEPAGRGLEGGMVHAFHETSAGTMLAAGATGIYRYDATAGVWTLAPSSPPSVTTFASDAAGVIHAGAWSSYARSTDDGRTWTQVVRSEHHYIVREESGGVVVVRNDQVSTDGGATWAPWTGPYLFRVIDMGGGRRIGVSNESIHSSTDAGASWILSQTINGLLAVTTVGDVAIAGGQGGTYRSTDAGVTWDALNALPVISATTLSDGTLLLGAIDPRRIGPDNGLHRSLDSGRTWQLLVTGAFLELTAASDGSVWAATLRGPARSTDGGMTWTAANTGFDERLTFVRADEDGTFWAESQGIRLGTTGSFGYNELFHSSDDGRSWRHALDSVHRTEPLFPGGGVAAAVATERLSAGVVTLDWTTRVTTDHGATWRTIARSNMRRAAGNAAGVGALIIVSGPDDGFYVTTDRGANWARRALPGDPSYMAVTPSGRIVVGTRLNGLGAIQASDDAGLSWRTLTSGRFINGIIAPTDSIIVASAYDNGDSTYRYESSTDGGATWRSQVAGTYLGNIYHHEGTIFIPGYADRVGTIHVDRTTDGGATWQRGEIGMLDMGRIRPEVSPNGVMLTVRREGLIRSTDYGASWEVIDTVRWPASIATNGRVIIASAGYAGLFRTTLPSGVRDERAIDAGGALEVMPVPARDQVVVRVDGAAGRVAVVDMTGRIVRAHDVATGNERVVITVGDLDPGVYFVRMTSRGAVRTGRIVVAE